MNKSKFFYIPSSKDLAQARNLIGLNGDVQGVMVKVPQAVPVTLLPAPPTGFAYDVSDFFAGNQGVGNVHYVLKANGLFVVDDTVGASTNLYSQTDLITRGALVITPDAVQATIDIMFTYRLVPLAYFTVLEAALTNAFQDFSSQIVPAAGKAVLERNYALGFSNLALFNVDNVARRQQFRVTRNGQQYLFTPTGDTPAFANSAVFPGLPLLYPGDIFEARLLAGPSAPGECVLRGLLQLLP